MDEMKCIDLEVTVGPTSAITLKERLHGTFMWEDLLNVPGLFMNYDEGAFYRALDVYLAALARFGIRVVSFDDVHKKLKP